MCEYKYEGNIIRYIFSPVTSIKIHIVIMTNNKDSEKFNNSTRTKQLFSQ